MTLFCPSRLMRTANSRTTLCAFFGCWLTPLRRILVILGHQPKTPPIRRLTLWPRKWALRSLACGLGWGRYRESLEAAAARFVPASSDDDLSLPVSLIRPTASKPSATYHQLCGCVAYVSVCVRVLCNNFCFVFVCVHVCCCPSVYIPMCLSSILCSYICTAFSLRAHLSLTLDIYLSWPLLFEST